MTIEYFQIDGIPDQDYFHCERYSATLAVSTCAKMWRSANIDGTGMHMQCLRCPVGALHAGETAASMSPLRGSNTCARCQRVAERLIGKHICVSCYNRQRELTIGRNAKGTKPTKLKPLHRRKIRYQAGSEVEMFELEHSESTAELIVATLRDSTQHAVFSFCGFLQEGTQMRLW